MTTLDEQEQLIMRALVRNPRSSDNRISALTGVPVRTVSRKRARLERDGVLTYYWNRNAGNRHRPFYDAAHATH